MSPVNLVEPETAPEERKHAGDAEPWSVAGPAAPPVTAPLSSEPAESAKAPRSLRSLQFAKSPRSASKVAAILIGLVLLVAAVLIWVPWQQTIVGYGQVIVYSAMDRPQNVEALIPGRLVDWKVQEGDVVKKGQVIAEIEDIDSKFLDPEQQKRLAEQREAMLAQRARIEARVARLEDQFASLTASREAAVRTAAQRIAQARQRETAAQQALVAARKEGEIAKDVAQESAGEKVRQAKDRVTQAEQALKFAQQDLETARLQRDRIVALEAEGLRSVRDKEIALNEYVSKVTKVEQARQALEVAGRDVNVGRLDLKGTGIVIQQVNTDIERARAALSVAQTDVLNAQLDLTKVQADTAAQLDGVGASIEGARESIGKINADLQKLEIDRKNLQRRVGQQVVAAPRDGRVVRLLAIGEGSTVKAGDVLAVLAPETQDRTVELTVSDNDVPLLAVGRKVRLQFAGWPALQFVGWPSVAVGTFAGEIKVIDAVDDGTARYRIIVEEDKEAVASGKDEPWPSPDSLRPGAEAVGWVLLDTVPLGFELWRQFNAFPPTVQRAPVGEKTEKPGKDKEGGDKKSPFIKVKQPK